MCSHSGRCWQKALAIDSEGAGNLGNQVEIRLVHHETRNIGWLEMIA